MDFRLGLGLRETTTRAVRVARSSSSGMASSSLGRRGSSSAAGDIGRRRTSRRRCRRLNGCSELTERLRGLPNTGVGGPSWPRLTRLAELCDGEVAGDISETDRAPE